MCGRECADIPVTLALGAEHRIPLLLAPVAHIFIGDYLVELGISKRKPQTQTILLSELSLH